MRYVSTRGKAPALGFSDVLLAGLAADGGLYVPERWPIVTPETIAGFAGRPYPEVAYEIVRLFVDDEIADYDLRRMCEEAYAGFRHKAVAPLVQLAPNEWVLELFHGPTLAFKDFAMQLLSRLMDHVLAERGELVTILAATSGDTGGAAVEAFRERRNVDLFVLFPENRVSNFQRRQMTTADAANVHAVAVKGTFDDCQALVKSMLGDPDSRERFGLTAVNSINFARIAAQIVYYFTAAASLGAPARSVSFTVPTGNFGDIYAGYAAKRMGLPIERLIIATNINDILSRTLASGRYELGEVKSTQSPSMDIQVSSNFERLLFEAEGQSPSAITALTAKLAKDNWFGISEPALKKIRGEFSAGRADESDTSETMAEVLRESGFLADPHTAVGLAVARRYADPAVPMVTLSTAHPAKFSTSVVAATGVEPQLPQGFADILSRKENYAILPNDRLAIAQFIEARASAVREVLN